MPIKCDIESIHNGMTKNFNYYTKTELEGAIKSWLKPYLKPLIKNHSLYQDPLGRVVDASFTRSVLKRGSYCSLLRFEVNDPEAIEKFQDGRYKTVSVGSSITSAVCSICKNDWATGYCEHRKGRVYDEKLCYWKLGGVSHYECSVVNAPADEYAQVISIENSDVKESLDQSTINTGTINKENTLCEADGMPKNIEEFINNTVGITNQKEQTGESAPLETSPVNNEPEQGAEEQDTVTLEDVKNEIKPCLENISTLEQQVNSLRELVVSTQEQITALSKQNVDLANLLYREMVGQFAYLAVLHGVYNSESEAVAAAEKMSTPVLRTETGNLIKKPLPVKVERVDCPGGGDITATESTSQQTKKKYTFKDLEETMFKLLGRN
jgi:hypothetical protein